MVLPVLSQKTGLRAQVIGTWCADPIRFVLAHRDGRELGKSAKRAGGRAPSIVVAVPLVALLLPLGPSPRRIK